MIGLAMAGQRPATAATRRRRHRVTLLLVALGIAMLLGYSVIFHWLMALEGHSHSWATSFYWTVTTMSTLGYGDITFTSDTGRVFSVWVLISGLIYLLVLLPFVMVQYVLAPWLDRRDAAKVPRQVPAHVRDHLILVGSDAVVQTLIARAERSGVPCVLVTSDQQQASSLHDRGFQVVLGALDSVATYRKAGADRARMVVSTLSDTANTNVTFTVRQVAKQVRVAVTANKRASVDVLELAGADHVMELGAVLGQEMAGRVLGTTGRSHRIGAFGPTVVAEAAARGTTLVGLSPAQAKDELPPGIQVLAIIRKGRLRPLEQERTIGTDTVLILAGSEAELAAYDARFRLTPTAEDRVLVLGGGRVGRAAARTLSATGMACTIIEQVSGRVNNGAHTIHGDAADLEVLRAAGLEEAQAALVTTHDDDLNVYLTLYCRRLRPELQVVSRATHERNVATLYRAGADGVLSYATIGATELWNHAGLPHRMVIAEGNELFLVQATKSLTGLSVRGGQVHERTGCRLVAIMRSDGVLTPATEPVSPGDQLLLLGDRHAEETFRRVYLRRRRQRRKPR